MAAESADLSQGPGSELGSDYDFQSDYNDYEEPGLGCVRDVGKPFLLPRTRTMKKKFECAGVQPKYSFGDEFEREPHGKRASTAKPKLAYVMVTKVVHMSPFGPNEYDERESFLRESCAKFWLDEEVARKQYNKRKAEERKTEAAKRHKVAVEEASGAVASFDDQLRKKLEADALKRLCEANQVMVSGTKDALIVRLVNVKVHGRPGRCPKCKYAKLDLVFPMNKPGEPNRVQCRHSRGAGRMCGWGRQLQPENKATVLCLPLVDSDLGDLANVGISF